ncbi:MAG: hypothetical protein LBF58_00460 [Deltaproteobacteria bacterium]|jgi:hypothetical protein|nr:hypothetical protein [Deltaproteobacteria bacterium]
MEMVKRIFPLTLKALAIVGFVVAVAGCAVGPMDPGRRQLEAKHRNWIDLIQNTAVSDKIYELTDRGDVLPIMLNALALDDRVLAEARNQWGVDPRFMEKINTWLSKGRIVVLVGLYTRDIQDEDILKNNRFRLSLRTGGGLKTDSTNKELLKGNFVVDYFPIFNPWEKVLAVSFDGLWDQNPILVLDCPYGSREISLLKRAKL